MPTDFACKPRATGWLRLLAAAVLLVISLQALAPGTMASPVTQRGSAFSALTADVSLAPRQHHDVAQRLVPLPDPLPTLPPVAEIIPARAARSLSAAPAVAAPPIILAPRERPEVPAHPQGPPLS